MTARSASEATGALLDYDRLAHSIAQATPGYCRANPFPHCVIDDFLPREQMLALADCVPDTSEARPWKQMTDTYADGDTSQTGKLGLPQEQELPALIRQLLWEMNGARFLRLLETLTGISGLIADPRLHGGGIHQVLPGGHLGVHADFTEHRYFGLDRRLNVLLYLNPQWQDDWGGHLELWQRDLSACARRLRPVLGRLVVFSTDASSFHGHPDPVACPPGTVRRSLALYYYSNGRESPSSDPGVPGAAAPVAPVLHTDWRKTVRNQLPALE